MHAIVGRLPPPPNEQLKGETPMFIAAPEFAREFGGPLTRAFLDWLPADWSRAPLVIDSFLVGLARAYDPGPVVFHREVYPEQAGGAYDLANGEREVEHIHAVFGPSLPQFIDGRLDESALPPMPSWNRRVARERDALICARLADGGLTLSTPREGDLVRYDGSTWLRWPRAEEVGFHFWIRATRGSRRPLVNGRRNKAHM